MRYLAIGIINIQHKKFPALKTELGLEYLSPSYADLQTNLISIWYPLVVIT